MGITGRATPINELTIPGIDQTTIIASFGSPLSLPVPTSQDFSTTAPTATRIDSEGGQSSSTTMTMSASLPSSSFGQAVPGTSFDHTLHLVEYLLIGLFALLAFLGLCFLAAFLIRRRRRRSWQASNTQEENLTQDGLIQIHSPPMTQRPPILLPLTSSENIHSRTTFLQPSTSRQAEEENSERRCSPNECSKSSKTPNPTPKPSEDKAVASVGRAKKPQPLDLSLSNSRAITASSSVPIAVKSSMPPSDSSTPDGTSPALIEARKRLQQQRGLSPPFDQWQGSSSRKTPSMMAAVVAASGMLGITSYSPPISAAPKTRVEDDDSDLEEEGKEEEEEPKRWTIAETQTKGKVVSTVPPDPEKGPIRYLASFGLPISATPADLPTTPLTPLPPVRIEEPPDTLSPPPQKTSFLSPQSTGGSRERSSTRHNTFGVEDEKEDHNGPSSAPALGAANRILQMQEQHGLVSAFSEDNSRSQSSKKSSSSGRGSGRCSDGSESRSSSRNQSQRQSPNLASRSRTRPCIQHSVSSLSLRSSMLRTQVWLNSPESPTAPMGYAFA